MEQALRMVSRLSTEEDAIELRVGHWTSLFIDVLRLPRCLLIIFSRHIQLSKRYFSEPEFPPIRSMPKRSHSPCCKSNPSLTQSSPNPSKPKGLSYFHARTLLTIQIKRKKKRDDDIKNLNATWSKSSSTLPSEGEQGRETLTSLHILF